MTGGHISDVVKEACENDLLNKLDDLWAERPDTQRAKLNALSVNSIRVMMSWSGRSCWRGDVHDLGAGAMVDVDNQELDGICARHSRKVCSVRTKIS